MDWNFRGLLAVLGGVIANAAFGVVYSYGNMAPYIISYIRERSTPSDLRHKDGPILFAVTSFIYGGFMPVGGILLGKFGPKVTVLFGGGILSAGVMLSYLAIDTSFYILVVTYGVLFGLGMSIGYTAPLVCAMKWFPTNKGVVNGIVSASIGISVLYFAPIQTTYINPRNLTPNFTLPGHPRERYFDDADVLDRTRMSFIILGSVYAALIIVGTLLISEPPADHVPGTMNSEKEMLIRGKDTDSSINDSVLNQNTQETSTADDRGTGLNLHPKEMLKTKEFWILWTIFFIVGIVIVFMNTLYKAFGQTFISDDKFLAVVGSASGFVNAAGKVFWGSMADLFSFKAAIVGLSCSVTIFMLTLMFVPAGGKWMFLFWVCAIIFESCGIFALMPTATSRAFGTEHIGINMACVTSGFALSGPVGAMIPFIFQDIIGWNGLFVVVAACSAIAFILSLVFNVKRPTGEYI